MSNWYVSSVAWTAVTAWAALTVTTLGTYRRQTAPAVGNERVFKCTTAGTTGAAEPTWNLGNNATTVDGTVTWTQVAGKEAENATWQAPIARLETAIVTLGVNGDFVYVRDDHTQTVASALTFGPASAGGGAAKVICVRTGCSIPPVSGDESTGASVNTTGASGISFRGGQFLDFYVEGVSFHAGSGASTASITLGTGATTEFITLKNCLLELAGTSASSIIGTGGASIARTETHLINTPMKFGAAGQGIQQNLGSLIWINTPSAVQGTSPTNLVKAAVAGVVAGPVLIRGCDLSGATGTLVASQGSALGQITIVNCKLASGVTMYGGSEVQSSLNTLVIDNCDDDTNYRFYRASIRGIVQSDSVIARGGGATDGVTNYSWKLTSNSDSQSDASTINPFKTHRIRKRYATLGSSVTATVQTVINRATGLTDAEMWLEIESLMDSGFPESEFTDDRIPDVLSTTSSTTQTASTSNWTAGTNLAARQDSHAYSLGDPILVSSNSDRIFFCSTAGTSSGSLPAGYASAVDGGTVTDGTAVFRAGVRQKLEVTFTPDLAGAVFGRVCLGIANVTVYVDPKMEIA